MNRRFGLYSVHCVRRQREYGRRGGKLEIVVLRAQIEWFKKKMFGGGKSETLDRAQLMLALGALEKLEKEAASKPQVVSCQRQSLKPRQVAAEQIKNRPVKETVEIVPDEVQEFLRTEFFTGRRVLIPRPSFHSKNLPKKINCTP